MFRQVLAAMFVAFLAAFIATTPTMAANSKIAICHADDEGGFRLINVAEPAVAAHLQHGDGLPGGGVPGMDGFVFGEGCVVEEVEPPADPIAAGCYESSTSRLDLMYLGPANTAGNVEFLASNDGTCSNEVAYADAAVITALDAVEASTVCTSVGLSLDPEPLNGPVYGYTGLPANSWVRV